MNRIKAFALLLVTTISLWAGDPSLEIYGWVSPWTTFPSEQQISHLTHLVIFPLFPRNDGSVYSEFSDKAIDSLVNMGHRNGVTVLFSFGANIDLGQNIESDPTYRDKLVSNLITAVDKYGVDGFDNSWEPPFHHWDDEDLKYKELKAAERQRNGLNQAIRDSLNSRFGDNTKMFTVTVGGTNGSWFANAEYNADNSVYPDSCWKNADRVLLMNYNDGLGANQSTYDNMIKEIDAYASTGMPRDIMVPGFLFHGQALWGNKTLSDGTVITSTKSYKQIMSDFPDLPLDQDTVVYTFYDEIDTTINNVDTTIQDTLNMIYGFNGVMTIRKKLEYISANGFPGSMHWEVCSDVPLTSEKSLIREISTVEPFTPNIEISKEFGDTLLESSTFSLTYYLNDYFNCIQGTMKFSASASNRHSVTVSGDTLVIVGDEKLDGGVASIAVRAENYLNDKDYKSQSITVITHSQLTDSVESVQSSDNYMLAETWKPYGMVVPVKNELLRTINSDGDTTIPMLGVIKDSKKWADATMFTDLSSSISLGTDSAIVITYRATSTSASTVPLFIIKDGDGVLFSSAISSLSGEWVTDTLRVSQFTPGWEQPDSFDFGTLSTMMISMGLQEGTAISNFELKSLTVKKLESTPLTEISMIGTKQMVSLIHNRVTLSVPLTSEHSVSMYNLSGRKVWSSSISPNTQSIALPQTARGVYIVQISGNELTKAIKIQAE